MHRNRFLLASIINFALALFCTSGLNAQTFKRGDFTATNAFYWSDTDLSSYAGTDLGSTPYSILLTDGAGKTARGFIGAVGAGETLVEKLTGWSNIGYETFEKTGKNITSFINSDVDGNCASNKWTVVSGELYRTNFSVILNSGAYPQVDLVKGEDYGYEYRIVSSASFEKYITLTGGGVLAGIYFWINGNTNGSVNPMHRRVTDPPATGVHIVSAYGGSTRAWTSIDSGFNPNTITSALLSQEDEDRLILPAIKKVIKKTTKNVIKR